MKLLKTSSCEISSSQKSQAKDLSDALSIPYGDALHAILARDNEAMLITRDRHFQKISWLKPRAPEDII